MPQRRTRAAPYPSLYSTCRRVMNYQQFHQGVGILWLHLQIASVQKLRSLLYAVPQVLRFSHFCDLMSIVCKWCLICHIKHSGIDAFKCPGWQPAFVLSAEWLWRWRYLNKRWQRMSSPHKAAIASCHQQHWIDSTRTAATRHYN